MAIEYTRTPSGELIEATGEFTPVSIAWEGATTTDFDGWEGNVQSAKTGISNGLTMEISPNCEPWPEYLTGGWNYELPVGTYESVVAIAYSDTDCAEVYTYLPLETNEETGIIFEIVGEEPPIPSSDFVLLIPILFLIFLYCFFEIVKIINNR